MRLNPTQIGFVPPQMVSPTHTDRYKPVVSTNPDCLWNSRSTIILRSSNLCRRMSALGQKRTLQSVRPMSALPPKADITPTVPLSISSSAPVDPTSFLHKPPQLIVGVLGTSHVPQCSRPFADRLAVSSVATCAANDCREWIRVLIERTICEFERVPQQSVGPST